MTRLKSHHYDLLRRIIAARQLPRAEVDGRMIRPLSAAGLVQVEVGHVTATKAGRTAAADAESAGPSENQPGKLSAAQEDLLRRIIRHSGITTDQADRRTIRALRARGLISEVTGQLSATADAAAAFRSDDSGSARTKRGRRPERNPRAEAILKAVERLEQALPPQAEVLVGSIMCAADDLTEAFRQYARKLNARPKGPKT
jgi:hypothetical protein